MSDPFIGQLLTVAFSWAPSGWALCQGQKLAISQNQALYALVGTAFGGDAVTNFAVPNLAGRSVIGMGADTWGNQYPFAKSNTVVPSVGLANLPSHSHSAQLTPPAPPTSVVLTGSINQALSGALSGGLGGTTAGNGDNTPSPGDLLGTANIQVYVPSGGTAVALTPLNLQGSLTGTPTSPVTATVTSPASAATVSVADTGTPAGMQLPSPPYIVQVTAIATTGLFPNRP